MSENPVVPSLLSPEFHLKFFPQLLWSRLRTGKTRSGGSGFNHNMEFIIVLFLCLILAAIGLPSALSRGSVVGWILSILGVGGILVSFIFSIFSSVGTKPSYDDFLIGTFFFFIFLGLTAGLFVGKIGHHPLSWCLLSGALGLFLGYSAGILAGLWFQCLGWLAVMLDMLAGLAIIGMIVLDLTLFFL